MDSGLSTGIEGTGHIVTVRDSELSTEWDVVWEETVQAGVAWVSYKQK